MQTINNKTQFYREYQKGTFGNKFRSWASSVDMRSDNFSGLVGLRSLTPDFASIYDIHSDNIDKVINETGKPAHKFNIGEQAPDKLLTLQGEFRRSPMFIDLQYSFDKCQMKRAKFQHCFGLTAINLLKRHMDASSYDNITRLLNEYDSIIEFSCYSIPVGILKQNTVIWEVRNF